VLRIFYFGGELKRRPVILLLIIVWLMFPAGVRAYEVPRRIISLAPNMTEILFALGLGDRIVGVSNFCDVPEEANKKPKVGGMSNPSLEAVVSLKPDMVVMTTDGNPREFEERLRALGIRTYVSTARRVADLPRAIRETGAAMGVSRRAEKFVEETEAGLRKFSQSPARSARKKVLFIVWPEPLIVAGPGTVIDDAIALAGAGNVASKSKSEYPKYSLEAILRDPPDVIVVGKGMQSGIRDLTEGVLRRLQILPAVKEHRVFYVSDDLYRLGPRTIRGIEELKAVLEGKGIHR
jgi:iron complex transport system substrate-binding protein